MRNSASEIVVIFYAKSAWCRVEMWILFYIIRRRKWQANEVFFERSANSPLSSPLFRQLPEAAAPVIVKTCRRRKSPLGDLGVNHR